MSQGQGKRKRKGKGKGAQRKPRTTAPEPRPEQETSADGLDLSKAEDAPAPAETPSTRRRRRAESAGDSSLPLAREKSLGRVFGLVGLGCTVMTFVGIAFANRETQEGSRQSFSLFGGRGDDISEAEELQNFAAGETDQLIATVLQSTALLLAIPIGLFLLWLLSNRGAIVPRKLRWLTFAGPILFTLSIVVIHIALGDVADTFVSSGPETNDRAEDVRGDSTLLFPVGGGLDLVGRLAFAFWLGLLSRELMHVELLTRFLGVFGIGAAFAFFLGALGVDIGLAMYIGWLASVAILALGRWPGGRPDGWTYRIQPET